VGVAPNVCRSFILGPEFTPQFNFLGLYETKTEVRLTHEGGDGAHSP
jgi:hypothetical protein